MLGLRELVSAYHRAGIRPNPFLCRAGLMWPAWALHAGPSAISLATARLYNHLAALIVLFLAAALVVEAWNVWRHGVGLMAKSLGYGLLCGFYISLFGGFGYLREGFAYSAAGSTLE